jgi:hypothetical protein
VATIRISHATVQPATERKRAGESASDRRRESAVEADSAFTGRG